MTDSDYPAPKLSRLPWLGIAAAPLPILGILAVTRAVEADVFRYIVLASVIWGAVFGLVSWHRLDEGSKEAYKFAFNWGAGLGMWIAAFAALMLVLFPQAGDIIDGALKRFIVSRSGEAEWREGPTGFFLGIALVIAIQQMLVAIAWIGWWARRRLP